MLSISFKRCNTELKLTKVWRDVEDHVGAADPNTRRGTGTDLRASMKTHGVYSDIFVTVVGAGW